MFLDWINEINLLSHNPETNILLKFPYSTKRILIYEVTNCFMKHNNKTINNNINSYINNYQESTNIVITNSNTAYPNNNNNNSNNNNNNTVNPKKAGTFINGTLVSSPVVDSAISASISNDDINNNIENLTNFNIKDTDDKSLNNKTTNSISNSPLVNDTNIKSFKNNNSISENNTNNLDDLEEKNINSSLMHSSPCTTETFITSPKIDDDIPWTWLISVKHVQWVMEIIGQGFALPPTEENVKIIQNACAIYTQWLLDPMARPYIIQAKEGKLIEQVFWQKIFHHFSLLFYINEKTTIYHQELCKQVLSVISMAERTLGNKFSEETWIILLKVLLGISDYLLREPLGKTNQDYINSSVMADKLCEHIIRVLIETWLRSQTKRTDMWKSLKKYFKNWTHRIGVIELWNATIYGLTQKVINILYGPNYGKSNVNIVINGCIISLDLSSDFVIYSWAQMLYMMGDITALQANNFNCFLNGISNVVDLFHSIDNKSCDEDIINGSSPDGNTILNLFSNFLFTALSITKDYNEYNKGKAIAFSTICKIIVKPQLRLPINQNYLDRIYTLLSQGLNSDFLSVTSIIKNSRKLFQQELKGCRLLFPDYIISIFKFLPKIFSCNLEKHEIPNPEEDFESLRLSCYIILSHIYSYPNHFYEIPVREELQNNEIINGKKAFMDESVHFELKPMILEILLNSLRYETNEDNLNFLLYLIYCFTYDDIKNTKGLLKITNDSIINTLILNKDYSMKLTKDALDTLFDLSGLQSFDTDYEPQGLIMKFCAYIDILLMEDNVVPYQYIICTTYEIITNWVINGTWILKYKYCLNCVISILSKGAYYSNKQSFVNMPNVVNLIHMEKDIVDEPLSEFIKRKLIKRNNVSLNLPNSKVNSKEGTSTSTEDGGIGVPTFAILSSALMIEKESEVCLNIILNHFGYFPPFGNNTSICNTGSLWNEENELINLIKLKYKKNKNLQLQNKDNNEIIQLFLEQENDNNVIQYYSIYDELIIGVLSLPSWYINTRKKIYIDNNTPVIKSKSTNSDAFNNPHVNLSNKYNSEILDNELTNKNLTINITNASPVQYNAKKFESPEHSTIFELDKMSLTSPPLEVNNPELASLLIKKNKSETSLYELNMESPTSKGATDKLFEEKENSPNSINSENNPMNSSKTDQINSEESTGIYTTNVPPGTQSNTNFRESISSNVGIKSINNENSENSNDTNNNSISISSMKKEKEELKDIFVAYIVRNCTGKFTWISSLKYDNTNNNNNKNTDIINSIINKTKSSSISSESSNNTTNSNNSESFPKQEKTLTKYCNSTSNINCIKLNEEDFTKLKNGDETIFEHNEISTIINDITEKSNNNLCNINENGDQENNKQYKIFNCSCFNESELPTNKDIIDDKNKKSYNKIEKIFETLSKSEEKVYNPPDLVDKNFKKIKKIEMPKCKDMNDSEEKDTNLRLHLIHNNFISLENYKTLIPLKKSVKLFKDLDDLDKTSSRERFTYSVFYVPNENSTIEEIFHPKFINKDFKSFIYSMCWLVNPQNHTGYLGGFTQQSKQNIPYYADRKVEMILHIPYFIDDNEFNDPTESKEDEKPSNQEEFINGFKEFSKNNNIHIIWMGKNNINANKVLNNLYKNDIVAKMYYIIYPYDYTKGLYKINIFKSKPSKLVNAIRMKNLKKKEVEKARIFHNSKSVDFSELNNSKFRNDFEIKSKNLQKVEEENSNEFLVVMNEQKGTNGLEAINNNFNNNNNNSNNDNTRLSHSNNISQYNFDDIECNRKSSSVSYNGSMDSSKKSIQDQGNKIIFHPVLIENKANKKYSIIANKDSQGVYIPKSDKPKQTIGPIIDGMIVRQNSLGFLIRKSILNYSLDKINIYSRSISQRKKTIKTLCTNYHNNSNLSQYYSSLI